MSYEFYKVLHITGVIITVFGLFAMAAVQWNGSAIQPRLRKISMMAHGIGLLILIVAGFGLAAKLGLMGSLPKWIYGKLTIWVLIGALAGLIKRKPQNSGLWIALTFILVIAAATLAVTKPF